MGKNTEYTVLVCLTLSLPCLCCCLNKMYIRLFPYMSTRINNSVLCSRPVNCLHAELGISETDVAGSDHVMN